MQFSSELLLLAPYWLVMRSKASFSAVDLRGLGRIDVEGKLAEQMLQRSQDMSWIDSVITLHNPLYREFFQAMQQAELRPMNTRAELLRGMGFERLFLELTAQCNEQCEHCYAESTPLRKESLREDTVYALLADAKALGFRSVQLTGGDPLISNCCVPAVRYAAELGFAFIEIYTNGLALRGALYADIKEFPVSFAFSFYSNDAAVHDAITRTHGSHQRTLAAIALCQNDGIPFRVGIIAMSSNIQDVDSTVNFLTDRGVPADAIGIDVARSVGRGLFSLRSKSGVSSGKQMASAQHNPKHERSFGGSIAVSYDGNVYPCVFSRKNVLGNIYQQSLRDIIEDPMPVHTDQLDMGRAHAEWSSQLSCWECRARAALLLPSTRSSCHV